MKNLTFLSVAIAVILATGNLVAVAEINPLAGKVIALDAGHGGTSLGAQYPAGCADDGNPSDCLIYEKDVNLAVVNALESKLTAQGANVVIAERLSTRRDRVADAVDKCQTLYDRKCDVLVSVHHNGNVDPTHDGTLTIYNERKDIPLAEALHDSLLPLTNQDEGYLHGGYGMTVFENLVSAITEAYYITNDAEAWRYLNDLNAEGISNLVIEEADAQVTGLSNYFAVQSSDGDKVGNKGLNK